MTQLELFASNKYLIFLQDYKKQIIINCEVIVAKLYGIYELECRKIKGFKQFKIIESISVTGAVTEFLLNSLFENFMKKLDIRKVKYAEKIVDMKP